MLTPPMMSAPACPQCRYNLRGHAGDPVRCPECGHYVTRRELRARFGTVKQRFADLEAALDIQSISLLGAVIFAVPLLGVAIVSDLQLDVIPLLFALTPIALAVGAGREIHRLAVGPGWLSADARYQCWTLLLVAVGPLLWLACGITLTPGAHLLGFGPSASVFAFLGGLAMTIAIVIPLRVFPRIRARQSRAMHELVHLTAAGTAVDADRLRRGESPASLRRAMNHDSIYHILAAALRAAIAEVTGDEPGDPLLRPASDAKFGDYQCNAAMPLAKQLKRKPRDIAEALKTATEARLDDVIEPLEIAGPGFLNMRLRDAFLKDYLGAIPAPPTDAAMTDRLGMPPVEQPQRVVVEYSQPNIAKQMHVGHLRSTIIGDVFARVLSFEGHEVIRQNHIGDWGTQFGMLIRWYREHPLPTPATHEDVLEAIEVDYKAANQRDKEDPQFAKEARAAVAELQGGDPDAYRLWKQIVDVSLAAIDDAYRRLGVMLRPEDVRGESFYNDKLPDVINELRARFGDEQPGARAVVRDDQGAVCVFLYLEDGTPEFKNPDGEALPMIIQKSDGAYLYSTTDLAAARYRLKELSFPSGVGAERVIYVVDARQKLHFQMWMACARAAGWITPEHEVDHVMFGTVLGEDRRPLKTREGGTVKLRDLLDEAERRALALLRERSAEQKPADNDAADDAESIARAVGVASVKYADLRNDRNSDYVFTWDKMISFQGNTAPYMMYAYARIRSIYRKALAEVAAEDVYAPTVDLRLTELAERALALRLARFREVIDNVASDLMPHTLCTYLYDLAGDFMRFYESCPVLAADDASTRLSRLRLCDLTARTLKLGLGLLGIEAIERM